MQRGLLQGVSGFGKPTCGRHTARCWKAEEGCREQIARLKIEVQVRSSQDVLYAGVKPVRRKDDKEPEDGENAG